MHPTPAHPTKTHKERKKFKIIKHRNESSSAADIKSLSMLRNSHIQNNNLQEMMMTKRSQRKPFGTADDSGKRFGTTETNTKQQMQTTKSHMKS